MSDAFSESLAYPAQKQRAVASRSYRVKVNPANGQTFTSSQTINIDLPSNLAGTYLNWNQCYLKMKVTNVTSDLVLDRCGAAGFIERVQCQTSGAQIFDCPNWNVLMTLLMDMDSSPAYKAGYGNVLMGTNGGFQAGETLGSADTRTYCVPFTLHPFGLSTPHRLQPLFSLAPVQFKISLASKQLSGKATADTSNLTFTEVELVCVFTELSPGAQAQVDSMTGGVYNILASSYQNVGTNMADGATAVTANLGVSVSSLERVIVCHRPSASLLPAFFNLGNRVKNYLTQYQIFVNGESYPARPVIVEDSCAEALAEFLLSDHSLVDFNKQSSFNLAIKGDGTLASSKSNGLDGGSVNGIILPFKFDTAIGNEAGTTSVATSSNIGTFLTAVEMETGLSDGKSAKIYSGISTISSTVNYRGVYGSDSDAAQIDFFCQYTVLLSLNMRGTGVWSVAV
jgi:hypothetical protein